MAAEILTWAFLIACGVTACQVMSSCVATSGDLSALAEEIRAEVREGDTGTADRVADLIDAKAKVVEERAERFAEAAVDTATSPTNPANWIELLLAAGVSFAGTNVYRNKTRRTALAKAGKVSP